MKKIYIFHIAMITFLVSMAVANNISEESEAQVILNIFIGMLGVSYLVAILFGTFKK